MKKIKSFLVHRNFIFSLALFLGLFFGEWAKFTKWGVLPALAVVMTVSTLGVPKGFFRINRSMALPIIVGLLMNFVIHSGVLIGLGTLLVSDKILWSGIVLVAAVPPAVAIIPFTGLLGGDTSFSLMATIGGYLCGLLLTPILCLLFLGTAVINPGKVLLILLLLVVGPIIASQILVRLKMDSPILPYKGPITNWGFFVVIYSIIGLNRGIFFSSPKDILPLFAISFSATFLLGGAIDLVSRFLGIERSRGISIKLLGTLKNAGTAAGIALVLFGKTAALPAAILTTFMIVYFMWLSLTKGRKIGIETLAK